MTVIYYWRLKSACVKVKQLCHNSDKSNLERQSITTFSQTQKKIDGLCGFWVPFGAIYDLRNWTFFMSGLFVFKNVCYVTLSLLYQQCELISHNLN